MLFVIPWGRHWIIGTTDTDWDLDKAHPAACRRDIDYLLDHVNRCSTRRSPARTSRACTPGCGRCCRASPSRPRKLSREHAVAHPAPGLVVVAGGKYTTYRVMAKDAVDARRARAGRQQVPACVTDGVPLLGAEGYHALWNARHAAGRARTACTWPGSSTC